MDGIRRPRKRSVGLEEVQTNIRWRRRSRFVGEYVATHAGKGVLLALLCTDSWVTQVLGIGVVVYGSARTEHGTGAADRKGPS